jgi:hypothetical protein
VLFSISAHYLAPSGEIQGGSTILIHNNSYLDLKKVMGLFLIFLMEYLIDYAVAAHILHELSGAFTLRETMHPVVSKRWYQLYLHFKNLS